MSRMSAARGRGLGCPAPPEEERAERESAGLEQILLSRPGIVPGSSHALNFCRINIKTK